MGSTVTIKIKYSDNSKSFQESFSCADTHPSADVIKQLENDMRDKWEEMGGQYRDMEIHTTVK